MEMSEQAEEEDEWSEDLEWDEPVQSVQELAEKGIEAVPAIYIRPSPDRPTPCTADAEGSREGGAAAVPRHPRWANPDNRGSIPVIDLRGVVKQLQGSRRSGEGGGPMAEVARACEEWGFFQLVNHAVPSALLARARAVARQFFEELPLPEKQAYANTPASLTGYGSRMGVSKHSTLDWGDYFLHYLWPPQHRDIDAVWPLQPPSYRRIMDEYSREIHKLYRVLMAVFSMNLGLKSSYLEHAFGGKDASLVLRINYYPPCPQPHLTLGLGPHSDAGGITFLLQDDIDGLQVRKDNVWVTVNPIPNAIVVNIADQLQIISNGKYKSVEHRALVNQHTPRMTLAVFCNPPDDTRISPAPALIDASHPPLYRSMTYGEFLATFFKKGLDGKGYVEYFKTYSHS